MRRTAKAGSGRGPQTVERIALVLAREGPHGPVIHDVNRVAADQGMRPGARVTDMRALLPDLQVEDAAPEIDAADLAMLVRWSRRWCPWSQIDGASGLLLDSTGSAHLHGGENTLIRDMARAFGTLGLTAHIAIAPTTGAAWALARHGGQRLTLCIDGAVMERLAPLPVAALRLDGATTLLLGRLGLKTIGALSEVPREALIRRFRKAEALPANPVLRLDQATGRQKELLVSEEIMPPLRVIRKMAEPLGDLTGLSQVLRDLAGDLCAIMEARDSGARALRFTAYRVDGEVLSAEARTSRASRDAVHLTNLFDGLLDRLDPGFGVEVAALESIDYEVLGAVQDDLQQQRRDIMDFSRLIDRLVARLGIGSVLKPVIRGSHIPERAEEFLPAAAPVEAAKNPLHRPLETPLKLLATPEQAEVIHAVPDGPPARFRWRHQLHDIARSQGPERIAPEWWREKSQARLRDYYRVEDSEGRRYWLYREGLVGDGRGDNPRWFVHGLDA
ncbi:DNA polymerase Y family protein [Altererythrobacter sp. ZODW24]|uniref:Y-family DNA polymerase n=1 Tax=Altererythrobacter sp. ZODW24 TaxID=2185142 RepID=UPI000DF77E29|nr:DNA polymerase Y family protein [Altererythrobacter sp. ZODW24]